MAKAAAFNALGSYSGKVQGGMTVLLTRGKEYYREIARKSWDVSPAKRRKRVAEVRENLKKANAAMDQYRALHRNQELTAAAKEQLIEFVRSSKNPHELARKLLGAKRYNNAKTASSK